MRLCFGLLVVCAAFLCVSHRAQGARRARGSQIDESHPHGRRWGALTNLVPRQRRRRRLACHNLGNSTHIPDPDHYLERIHRGPSIPCAADDGRLRPRKNPTPSGYTHTPATRPNVLFMVADDLQPDTVRAYDRTPVPVSKTLMARMQLTPHMSTLARKGAMFTRAYTTHPYCSPSRYEPAASLIPGVRLVAAPRKWRACVWCMM